MILREGRAVHGLTIRRYMGLDLSIMNSLMDMYLKCNHVREAEHVFKAITERDLVSWNIMISGYSQNGHPREAQTLFKELLRWCSQCSLATLLAILPSCDSPESLHFGRSVHSWQIKLGFSNHILAVNSIMFITGHFWEALETFKVMRRESHVRHDSITLGTDAHVQNALITMYGRFGEIETAEMVFSLSQYSEYIVLSACTQLGVLRHGKEIHGRVFKFGFQRNSFISAALVDLYSNCGRLDTALQIFCNLPEKSVAAWNSVISAYGFHSNGRKSIELFHDMIESGTRPTKSTFINLLSACSHSGLVNEGLSYYEHMSDEFGVESVTEHHVCVVDMLGRSGRLCEAYEFIKRMASQPEPGVWGALLSACNYHGDLEMGREVATILFGLEPDNVGYYVSLSNMYVAAGRWSDAVELRRIIQDKQFMKPPGYSIIDAGFG
ncbi:hypothetical protein F0562_011773 [Nyssa sinensis]|uniref:Pentatricopeptide repeat-containing protein n=1 Tax=Nyssa sinensis TaxID=561372 RepID=A0A5J4ZTA0_9ASTE|nr:hypothetical protein F0562_011773 [Nyssa sinensis]